MESKSAHRGPACLTVLRFSVGYLSYALSKGGFILSALLLGAILTPWPKTRAVLVRRLTAWYLRFFTQRWLPGLGIYQIVEVTGLEEALKRGPVILAANHRGFMDALLLLGLLPNTGSVIKARDARQWTYGLLERHFDLVAVDRYSRDSVTGMIDRCGALLAAGKNLLVFPEGKRAASGRLQHFNRSAFQLALAKGLPVVPVIIHSTLPFMARVPGSIFPEGRNQYRIRFLAPEFPTPADRPEALGDRVWSRMARELRLLDAGTQWETR